MQSNILQLGTTNARQHFIPFGIQQPDRLFHTYVLGKTGVGKTTLLQNMLIQDMQAGRGCVVLDPHGDMAERLWQWIQTQPNQLQRSTYFNATDQAQPYGYNPIKRVSESLRPLLASGLLEVFKKLWQEAWGVRMEHIFRHVLLTLLDQPSATLADVPRLLNDKDYRQQALTYVRNPHVQNFWHKEFKNYSFRYRADAIAPVLNKVGGFLANPTLARILTESTKKLSLRTIMDRRQVLLVNLSKGQLGEDASSLLGGLLITSLGLAAFSRADQPEYDRVPFHAYVDEFQNFTTLSLVNMASELRKYALSLTLSHQYLAQLDPDIRSAVLGNVGTILSFRVGLEDARKLSHQFDGVFKENDLMNLPNHQYYLKLMIDGRPSAPFSATAQPPLF